MTVKAALKIMQAAGGCNLCFDDRLLSVERVALGVPHPRWIGEKYWSSPLRVAVVLINPGQPPQGAANRREVEIFRAFHDTGDYGAVREHFRASARAGRPWLYWYLAGYGLSLEDIAHLNVAWCATVGDKYPTGMTRRCFGLHTLPLLVELEPDVVLLSGFKIHEFRLVLERAIPDVVVRPVFHYAARTGRKNVEAVQVRSWLREERETRPRR